jgi:hypothetical protein
MRKALLMGLIAALGILASFAPAMADSTVFYLDGSRSDALSFNFGYAFVFYNDLNPPDIFIHVINNNGFANFVANGVTLGTNSGSVFGYSFFLSFEGFNGGFRQYGVYACVGFSNQTCSVNGTRRGPLFL